MKYTNRTTARQAGFTLIELIVVIVLISVLSAIALPSIFSIFNAGADSQAYNLLSAQLAAARAQAIRESNYVLVHCQQADPKALGGSLQGKFYLGILTYNKGTKTFSSDPNVPPTAVPGKIAFGQLRSPYVSGDAYDKVDGDYYDYTTDLAKFTTFSIVFSPSGTVVTRVNGNNITIDSDAGLFKEGPGQLWDWTIANDKEGVTAVTLFDSVQLRMQPSLGERQEYLNENGQFLAINAYTGQLFPKE